MWALALGCHYSLQGMFTGMSNQADHFSKEPAGETCTCYEAYGYLAVLVTSPTFFWQTVSFSVPCPGYIYHQQREKLMDIMFTCVTNKFHEELTI